MVGYRLIVMLQLFYGIPIFSKKKKKDNKQKQLENKILKILLVTHDLRHPEASNFKKQPIDVCKSSWVIWEPLFQSNKRLLLF